MSTVALLLLLLLCWATACAASIIHSTVPANPLPYHSLQPDGSSTPPLRYWGDGVDNYMSDEDGYVVVKNDEGWMVYAQDEQETTDGLRGRRLQDKVIPSRHIVGSVDPSTVSGLTTIHSRNTQSKPRRRLQPQPARKLSNTTTTTQFKSLILLLRFSDHHSRPLPTVSQFIKFFNKHDLSSTQNDIAPTGSIYELFHESSYGVLSATSMVVDWITLSETEEYYANGEYGFEKFDEAIREALSQVFEGDLLNDVERIDGLGILHSGYGAEYGGEDCHGQDGTNRIWSHQAGGLGFVNPLNGTNATAGIASLVIPDRYYVASALRNKCGSDITRVGIVAHELGHQLGLPDLYDRTFEGNGVGNYDPMSKSWGWDGTGLYPPIFSAWSKMTLGWVHPLEITSNGHYTLGSSANVPHVYIIRQGFAQGEYLLIENRQPEGYDAQLAGGGIAIWHIDEHANDLRGYLGHGDYPWNGNHYKVSLVQADGNQDLERGVNNGDAGDLWHRDGEFTVLGPSSPSDVVNAEAYLVPNTDSNRHGNVTISGVWIHNFTVCGEYMGFTVHGLGVNVNASKGYPHPNFVESESTPSASPIATAVLPTSSPTTTITNTPTASPVTVTTTASSSPITSQTLPPTSSPTTTASPSIDPQTIILFFPDWLQMGCRRKPLSQFSSWEKNRYQSVRTCCDESMPWAYSKCIQSSAQLIGDDLVQDDENVGVQMALGYDYLAAPPP